MKLQTLYDVPCPYCGAGFDEKCRRRPTGKTFPDFHEARRTAFKVARAAEEQARENAVRLTP